MIFHNIRKMLKQALTMGEYDVIMNFVSSLYLLKNDMDWIRCRKTQ